MANRNFQQFSPATILKKVVELYATVAFSDGSGTCTLRKWNPTAVGGATARTYTAAPTATGTSPYQTGEAGVKSVVYAATGKLTFTLQDTYQRLLGVQLIQANLSGGAATIIALGTWSTTDVTSAAAPIVVVSLLNATGTAAAPASGDVLTFKFILHDASEM